MNMTENDKNTGMKGDDHIQFHIRDAWVNMHSNNFRLPWDFNMQSVLSDGLYQRNKRLKVTGNLGPVASNQGEIDELKAVTQNSFADAGIRLMKSTDSKLWEQRLSMDRKAAYKKWTALVAQNFLAWSVARPKNGQLVIDLIRDGIAESIQDCLGIKATSTLHSRAGPLIRYAQFAKQQSVEPFPIREHVAYQFIKQEQLPPTFPRSFVVSVAFAKYTLGLLEAEGVLESSRIKGRASRHYLNKRRLTQRPPLTVLQIQKLENIVGASDRTTYDRVAAGFFLLLVFGRLRFSDAQSISAMELEQVVGAKYGYLECAASRCKTSTNLEKRTRLLPVVLSTLSFTPEGWIAQWLEVRNKEGLTVGANVPMLPNPAQGGGWTKVPMTCEVAGDWLRALLKEVPSPPHYKARLATHSCKSSILSMASKYGMVPSARRFLGYHSAGRDSSMLVYSRDSMSWPLRLMEEMIESINSGVFCPDAGRGGHFVKKDDGADDTSKDVLSKECASTSSSADSADEEEIQHSEDERAVEDVAGTWSKDIAADDMSFYRHPISRCIHVVSDEAGATFKCGRNITAAYLRCQSKPRFMHPTCSTCFR